MSPKKSSPVIFVVVVVGVTFVVVVTFIVVVDAQVLTKGPPSC